MPYEIDQVVCPSTVEEALEQFLDAQLPLEHGGNLVHAFKEYLTSLGKDPHECLGQELPVLTSEAFQARMNILKEKSQRSI